MAFRGYGIIIKCLQLSIIQQNIQYTLNLSDVMSSSPTSIIQVARCRRIDCEQLCSSINQQLVARCFGHEAFVSFVENSLH